MITPEQALLANALAEKALTICSHSIYDDGSLWISGGSDTGFACEQCIEKIILEAMEHPA